MKKKRINSPLQEIASARNWGKARLIAMRCSPTNFTKAEREYWKQVDELLQKMINGWDTNTKEVLDAAKR